MQTEHDIDKYSIAAAKSLQAEFERDGYLIVRSCIEPQLLATLETQFSQLVRIQLDKLAAPEREASLDASVVQLDDLSHVALTEACAMLRNTHAGHALAAHASMGETAALILRSQAPLVVSGPSLFVNRPEKSARKYTAHAEQNWYPKRRSFVNVWIPFVRTRPSDCTMTFWRNSHRKDWFYFSEYKGYGGSRNEYDNVQYEIPASLLADYEAYKLPDIGIGDAVFFSHRMVHASHDNATAEPLYAFSLRMYDYAADLTLGSGWAELPYKSTEFGVPGVQIR